MLTTEDWLGERDEGALEGNRIVDWICVPLIVIGLVGMFWSLPVPEVFAASPVLNWGTLFLMTSVVYYFILSISLAVGILPFIMLVLVVVAWLDSLAIPLRTLCGALFLVAWAAQLFGRFSTGRPVRAMTNLQHVMLAPVRLLATVYRRLGIPY
jgi:hypothetical protein